MRSLALRSLSWRTTRTKKFSISFLTWSCSCTAGIWVLGLKSNTNTYYSVVEQPFKIVFVAATVITINPHNPDLTQKILARAGTAIQIHLDAGAWREVKLVLRFLGCLQGLFEGDGVFPILEELFSRAVDLQTASSEDVSKELSK